jgi:glyoxylase-like metal-dependent hydrolase (beta-lactamase superfamily II)
MQAAGRRAIPIAVKRATLLLSISILGTLSTGCESVGYPVADAFSPPPSDFPGWESVLGADSAVEVRTLETGRNLAPLSVLLDLQDPKAKAAGLKDHPVAVPVLAHVVRHPRQGDFLIDTGLDASFRDRPFGNVRGALVSRFFYPSVQKEGEDLGAQLAAGHLRIERVFLTHLHPDHTAGMPALGAGPEVYVGKGEIYHNVPGLFFPDHLRHVKIVHELDFDRGFAAPPFDRVIDVFGDHSFYAISVPGHTRGGVAYLAITRTGPVLFTGDASHLRWGFAAGVEPGLVEDRAAARRSLAQLREFARRFPQVEVRYGHDR